MINRLSVRNFRCFETLDLEELSRINVIVGDNASGKTALLESIFFAAGGNPEILLRMRLQRGYAESPLQVSRDRHGYESLWREFFFSVDSERTISAEISGSPGQNRRLNMSYSAGDALAVPLNSGSSESGAIVPLLFEGTDIVGRRFSYRAEITDRGINIDPAAQNAPILFFPSGIRTSLKESADRFSDLSKRNQVGRLVTALRKYFPLLETLSLETSAGFTLIYAQVNEIPEKVPIGVVSGGIERILSLLLGIATGGKGVVLIDEIENGIHYTRIQPVWQLLWDFCTEYDTQVFLSTHSEEWLMALQPVMEARESEFCLLRAEVSEGRHLVKRFRGAKFRAALQQRGEVRLP